MCGIVNHVRTYPEADKYAASYLEIVSCVSNATVDAVAEGNVMRDLFLESDQLSLSELP